jgi:hypothetical protein
MSDEEDFLSRWSRRKREGTGASPPGDTAEPREIPDGAAPESAARRDDAHETAAAREGEPPAPEFDLSSLPSIESIGADSDIRAFLARGVPSSLRNAALRRAWTADPAIRDYIGLSENSWQFDSPDVPGFGPLNAADDVKKMLADVFGETLPEAAPPQTAPVPETAPEQTARLPDAIAAEEPPAITREQQPSPSTDELVQSNIDIAMRDEIAPEDSSATPARRHGGAMPQ